MRSRTLPSFWEAYQALDADLRQRARKAYRLWEENPFHPSLHFKCINREESIWSARISLGYRSVGIMDEEGVTWFWIGGHDAYERFFS
jgi:hypothetical protein